MEDYYYFHCFAPISWEIDHNAKTGPGHADDDSAAVGELHHHYLDACFGCRRLLARNKDIFMYRGDTPFCSEECRRQQIDVDEAKEKRSNQSAAAGSWKQAERQLESSSPQWILAGELTIEASILINS